MDNRICKHRYRGVTLLELVVVMSIVAILLSIAIPSYKYVTNSNRIAAEGNGLLGDLQYARAEAIKEGQSVTVCIAAVTPSNTCATASNSWASGWIIFSDVNGNAAVDPGDIVLRSSPAFTGTDTFTASGTTGAFTFNREGFAAGLTATVVTLHAVPTNNQSTRCLSVSAVGMMAITKYDGTTCL
jgi:type IV fimbrial biogenesis protein FimT